MGNVFLDNETHQLAKEAKLILSAKLGNEMQYRQVIKFALKKLKEAGWK